MRRAEQPNFDEFRDEALLRRAAAGEAEAFAALYRRRQGGIYRFAFHMSGSVSDAEEVVQETFLVLIRDPGQFDGARGPLVSFLYGIARHCVLRHIEQGRRHVELGEHMPSSSDPGADFDRDRRIAEVRRAVMALPPRYREAVVLCDLHEMSYAEAAEVTGCPVGTIRSRLNRARGLLAARLEARARGMRCFL